MKHVTRCLSLGLVSLALFAKTGLSDGPNEAGAVTRKEDVIYGRKFDLALTFDVFTPAKPKGVGIIHLANGGWHKAHHDPNTFAELLKRGYTVFRVVLASEPKFTIPEEAADVQRAVGCSPTGNSRVATSQSADADLGEVSPQVVNQNPSRK